MNARHYYQRGLTLLELLVAITLGLAVIAGTIQIYLGTSQTYRVQEAQSRIQENGRYALEVLTRQIRMAGFTGCALSLDHSFANVLNDPEDNWWSNFGTFRVQEFQQASLQGFNGGETFPAQSDGTSSAQRVAGTEALIVISGSNRSYSIDSDNPHDPVNSQFTLNNLQDLQTGDIFLVCDSNQISIAQVTDTNTGNDTFDHTDAAGPVPGNCTGSLGSPDPAAIQAAGGDPNAIDICADAVAYTFGSNAVLTRLTPLAFYIGVSTSGDSRSLFRTRLTVNSSGEAVTATQELIEHVEDMRILYGVGTPGGQINDYREAGAVADWRNVLSVRIDLLLASPPGIQVINETQTVWFPTEGVVGGNMVSGVALTRDDGRLRQVFSTTIGLRNRLP